jgi:hypothetical protein
VKVEVIFYGKRPCAIVASDSPFSAEELGEFISPDEGKATVRKMSMSDARKLFKKGKSNG